MICPLANFEEIFQTEDGAVYQCSRKNCYWLDFQGSTTAFKVRDFFAFKKRVDAVQDILKLKEVLSGAKFMIELNSEIKACLQSKALLAI